MEVLKGKEEEKVFLEIILRPFIEMKRSISQATCPLDGVIIAGNGRDLAH